jgi:hypothetical protein
MTTVLLLLLSLGQTSVKDLEKKLAQLPPYTAEYDFVCILPGGKKVAACDVLYFVDYAGMSFYARMRKIDGEGAEAVVNTALLDGTMWTWGRNGKGSRLDASDFLATQARTITEIRRDLDRLLPPTAEDPDPSVCAGIRVVLDVKDAENPKGDDCEFRIVAPHTPASWLSTVRASRDVSMAREGKSLIFRLPGRRKELEVDADTGVLLRAEANDSDGTIRRFVRRSFATNTDRPSFRLPDRESCPVSPALPPSRLLQAYEDEVEGAVVRMFERWPELRGKRSAVVDQFAAWASQSLERASMVLFDDAADRHVQRRLQAGGALSDLEAFLDSEARAFGDRSAQAGGVGPLLRRRLKEYLSSTEEILRSRPETAERREFLDVLREALSPDRVLAKVPAVEEPQLRGILKGALRRASSR